MKKFILLLFLLIPTLCFAKYNIEELKNNKWMCTKRDTATVTYELNVENIKVCFPQDTIVYHIYSLVDSRKTDSGRISVYYCGECIIKFESNINTKHVLYIEYIDKHIIIQ